MNYSPYQSTPSSNGTLQKYRQQQAIAQRRRMMRQAMNQQRMQGQNFAMGVQQHRMRQSLNQQRLTQQRMATQQQQRPVRKKPPNVLFYSNNCPHSQKFIKALQKNPSIFNTFLHVCVDKRGVKLPACVKSVPTIVVQDSSNRRQILTDYRAFEWLNYVIDVPVEIGSFQPGHMGTKLSDDYSCLDGSESNENSFAFLDELNKHYIFTPKDTESQRAYDQTEINFNQLEEARRNDPVISINKRAPPPGHEPDFTKSTIAEVNTVSNSDFDRAMAARRRESRQMRGPAPMHAPNFTSGQFRSKGFQSNRGGYVAAGEDVLDTRAKPFQISDYKKLVSTRQRDNRHVRQPQPSSSGKPDWSVNLRPMKVL